MKLSLSFNHIVNGVASIAIIALALSYYVSYHKPVVADYTPLYNNLPVIAMPLPDTLPHYKYMQLQARNEQTKKLKYGVYPHGSAWTSWFIGSSAALYCDTCTVSNEFNRVHATPRFYINLPGWKLRNSESIKDSVQYFVKSNQPYLRKTTYNPKIKSYQWVDVPVKFWYDYAKPCMLIPVSKSTKEIMDAVGLVLIIMLGTYFMLPVVAFVRFVIDISKGHPFTEKNVFRLKLISLCILAIPVAFVLFNLLVKLIFKSYFVPELTMKIDFWKDNHTTLCAGIVFLLLFKAFRQAMIMKEEHDLTV